MRGPLLLCLILLLSAPAYSVKRKTGDPSAADLCKLIFGSLFGKPFVFSPNAVKKSLNALSITPAEIRGWFELRNLSYADFEAQRKATPMEDRILIDVKSSYVNPLTSGQKSSPFPAVYRGLGNLNPADQAWIKKIVGYQKDFLQWNDNVSNGLNRIGVYSSDIEPLSLAERKRIWRALDPFAPDHFYPTESGVFPDYTYKAVDRKVDDLLGLRAEKVEQKVRKTELSARPRFKDQETYANIEVRGTQTSYADIQLILRGLNLQPGQKVVDLGSGYGRLGFAIGDRHPDVEFQGFELVPERRAEASRVAKAWGWNNVTYKTQDLSAAKFTPPEADVYFMYDPANNPTTLKILNDLKKIAAKRPIRIVTIDGTGRLSDMLPSETWLTKESEVAPNAAHFPIVTYSARAL